MHGTKNFSIMTREETVLNYLREHDIPFTNYNHPEGKTIEEAKQWWKDDGSVHCKNLFFRNHKGNRHYLVCFDSDHDLAIHDLELEPGSVSPFGLINDTESHVHLFLDENLQKADSLSFHPNDCRGTVVIKREDFERYLSIVGNTYEYIKLY